jgi:glycosylphosphatidylinositol deacylase
MLAAIGIVLSTILGLYEGYRQSTENAVSRISPQGCRMSWMSPSYVLREDFDEHWTPLARRYSLWLYREVEWDTSAVVSALLG